MSSFESLSYMHNLIECAIKPLAPEVRSTRDKKVCRGIWKIWKIKGSLKTFHRTLWKPLEPYLESSFEIPREKFEFQNDSKQQMA